MTLLTRRVTAFRIAIALLALGAASQVFAAAPVLSFTPTALAFKYTIGGSLPAAQSISTKSSGAVIAYTISVSGPAPYNAQWLSVSVNLGSTAGSLKVYVNPTGLPAGTYSGSVVFSAPTAASATSTFPVTLTVGSALPALTTSATTMAFSWVTDQAAPASQKLVLMSTGGAVSATVSTAGGSWLSASPAGSVSVVGLPVSLDIGVTPTGLSPGTYTAQIKIAAANASVTSTTIVVTLTVSAGVPTITNMWPKGAYVGAGDSTVTLTGTNFFSTSTAAIGTTPLAGTLLSPTTLLVTVPKTLLATAGSLSIVVTTPTASAASSPGTFTVYPAGPQVWAVTNSASYNVDVVSAGGLVTIFGLGLGPSTLTVFANNDPLDTALPTTAPSTTVTIDGVAAPLLYTSSTQISCIVPFGVAAKTGSKVNVVVTYNSIASTAWKVTVVDTDPGLFSADSSGTGAGAILNYSSITGDYTVNSTANAAARGSIVILYATGSGTSTCTDATGSTCIATPTVLDHIAGTVVPAASVAVTIGGVSANVLAAQSPIGSVSGVLQVNVTVPATAPVGTAVPVILTLGTAKSQTGITMAVK